MDSLLNGQYRLEDLLPLIMESLESGRRVRFSPKGTSMMPMLRQGIDDVILSPLPPKLKKYDLPLYRRSSGQFVLHRIVKVEETYTCVGDNQFEREPGLRHDQMLGLVTAFTRGKRVISVEDPAYRLYCRIWHYSRPLRRLWRQGIACIRRLRK